MALPFDGLRARLYPIAAVPCALRHEMLLRRHGTFATARKDPGYRRRRFRDDNEGAVALVLTKSKTLL